MRAAIAFLISGAAAAWFAWDVDWPALGHALASAHLGWVAASVLVVLGEFVIRAIRWKVLLRPLGPSRVRDLFSAQVLGAAANTLFPLRAGEVAKPLVAARRTGIPLSSVVATSVMERVYDLFGLVSVLVLMVVVLPDLPGDGARRVHNVKVYGGIVGVAAALAMTTFFVIATRPDKAHARFARLLSLLPAQLRVRLLGIADGFVAGLANARDRSGMWQSLILSVWLWVNGAVAIQCLFAAFDMRLPFGAACFTGVAVALTVAVPQAPGYLGVFQVAMEKTMLLWGQSKTAADAFAIAFWAVSFLPVTAVGVVALWREGIDQTALESAEAEAEGASPPGESAARIG